MGDVATKPAEQPKSAAKAAPLEPGQAKLTRSNTPADVHKKRLHCLLRQCKLQAESIELDKKQEAEACDKFEAPIQ